MYLLDTNILAEMRKMAKGTANENVVNWFRSIGDAPLFVSVVTLMEIERGVLGMERKDPEQGKLLRHWFETLVLTQFKHNTYYINDNTIAKLCAQLHVPDRSPENDAWIAATALRYKLTLVTRNTKDFEDMGVKVVNPFLMD